MKYSAETAIHTFGTPTVFRQFAYVLAPARAWKSFNVLDVKINLPEDWDVAWTTNLVREGDTLSGSFAELPGDSIALTLQAKPKWSYRPIMYGGPIAFGLAVLGGFLFCLRQGRTSGRRLSVQGKSVSSMLLFAFVYALVWGIVVCGVGMFCVFGPDLGLPEGQASHYGYGQGLAFFGVLFLSGLPGSVGAVL